jgi:hypothetical protein
VSPLIEPSRGGPINYTDADFKPNALRQSLVGHTRVCFVVGVPRRGRVVQVLGCVRRSRTARPSFGGWLLLRGRLQCTRRRQERWNRGRAVRSMFGQAVDRKAVRGDDRVACCGAEVAVLGEDAELMPPRLLIPSRTERVRRSFQRARVPGGGTVSEPITQTLIKTFFLHD